MSLKPLRRVVTGHSLEGRAVITHDTLMSAKPIASGAAELTLLWTAAGLPVNNDDTSDDTNDGATRNVGLTMPGGTVLRVVDMMPGKTSAMHRTSSIDFGIVMQGVIDLHLDDGVVTRLHAGEIVVQRGTVHAWHNPSADVVARVAFVLIDAKPATVAGAPLPERLPGLAQHGG